jgi:N-acetylglutamate synthase-like GNAT family acetyltransferase
MRKAGAFQVEIVKPTLDELTPGLFDGFQRYQEVNQVWRIVAAGKVLAACAYTEDWDKSRLERVVPEQLAPCLEEGGAVWIARRDGRTVAFAALLSRFFGSHNQYLELKQLQVSHDDRGFGLGQKLFELVCEEVRTRGARKLYISADPALASQEFYTRIGCTDAQEPKAVVIEREPYDIQMEYQL